MGADAGVALPGCQALVVEGEDDALAVDLGGRQPAQASAGVGGHECASRGVAAEPGQRPHLAEPVGEDDAADVLVEGGPGLLRLAVEAEAAAPDRELARGLRKQGGVEGVPLVAAEVGLPRVRSGCGRGGRGSARGLRDELVDEAVGCLGVLLDQPAERVGPGLIGCVEQERPAAVAADGLSRVLLRARGSADCGMSRAEYTAG